MATANDIAQVLATGLGLRTGVVMEHVRAAMEDGFLPEVGEADAAAAVTTLLTVAISQLSESPDQTTDLVHQFSELPLAGVKVWKAGQIIEPVKPFDALVNLISTKTVAGYTAQSFEEYLHSDLPDARYCAGISVGLMDNNPRVQIVNFPNDDKRPDGLCYQFSDTNESSVCVTREVTIAQPFAFLRMAMDVAESVGAAVEPTHFDVTTRRQ